MRILAITNQYPRPGHETIAAFNRQQFRELAASHELRVVAPVPWQEVVKDAVQRTVSPRQYRNVDGIEVYHPTLYYVPRLIEHRYGQFYVMSTRRTIERVVREFQPDVVLACWAHPDGWAALQLAREAGLPVAIKVIGSDVLVLSRHARRRSRIAQALRQADCVVAVSRDLAKHVKAMGADPRSVHVVPEGVDRRLFQPGDQAVARRGLGFATDGKRILFVGNLLISKGAAVLVQACRLLRERGVNFSCDLVGQGRDEAWLRAMILGTGLDDASLGGCVRIHGTCQHDRLPNWFRSCDLVALPSFSEGIPNVLREAMACGKPFVATSVGGIPEIAHPSYSRLVAPRDVVGLADSIAEFLKDPPHVVRDLVDERNVSWEDSAALLGECLANVLPARRHLRGNEVIDVRDRPRGAGGRLRRLRILAITNQYPRPAHDGVASFNRQQFRALAAIHDLRVIAPIPWTEVAGDLLKFDGRCRHYLNRDLIWVQNPCFYYLPRLQQHQHGQYLLRSIRSAVLNLVDDFKPDVLLGCWAFPDGWATVRIAREAGLPVIVKVHGSDVLVMAREADKRIRIAEALMAADRVVAVSQDLANHVVELGVPWENVCVVRNGVDKGLFTPGNQGDARRSLGLPLDGRMMLFVGNILLSKGLGVLVEACSHLRRRGVEFHARIVGQGRDTRKLLSLIRERDLSRQMTLMGPCAHAQLAEWYRASDLVVLPSFSEGLPNVLQEAIACARPFVATRVGGIPEIARPSFSRLVPPHDASALASALAEVLADPPTVDVALAAAQSVSWDGSAKLLAAELEDVVAAHSRNGEARLDAVARSTIAGEVSGN